jgi:hypothetical protein
MESKPAKGEDKMFQRVAIGIAILLSVYLVGCGSGNNGSTGNGSNSSTSRQILAKNVLLLISP